MRLRLALALLAAALASTASAQPLTGEFRWQVSRDGASWSSALTLSPGDPYRIRALASWTDGPTPSHGFAGCTFEQIDLIGADASDVFGGASQPGSAPAYLTRRQGIEHEWLLYAGSGASEGGLRIDSEVGRVSLGQLPYALAGGIPNPNYSFDNPILLLDLSATAGAEKTIIISSTWSRLDTPPTNEFRVYILPNGINKKPVEEAVMIEAIVTIIPSPATASLVALASLATVRRRSR